MRLLLWIRAQGWFGAAGMAAVGGGVFLIAFLSLQYLLRSFAVAERATLLVGMAFSVILVTGLVFYIDLKRRELLRLKQKFVQRATHDDLTGCLNGPLFSTLVDAYGGSGGAEGEKVRGALLVVDTDHLRSINERFGYGWGDEALRVIANVIRTSVRSGDLVGRLGGQEFGVFLPGASRANAEDVAERIRTAASSTFFAPNEVPYPLTVSLGAVLFEHDVEFEELFRLADGRMRHAKAAGRNRVEYFQFQADDRPVKPTSLN